MCCSHTRCMLQSQPENRCQHGTLSKKRSKPDPPNPRTCLQDSLHRQRRQVWSNTCLECIPHTLARQRVCCRKSQRCKCNQIQKRCLPGNEHCRHTVRTVLHRSRKRRCQCGSLSTWIAARLDSVLRDACRMCWRMPHQFVIPSQYLCC
jgi:hypothetical protein